MKIRTTENEHSFQNRLFESIGIHSLQGLLMDEDNNFTAAIEAVQFDDDENVQIPFNDDELNAPNKIGRGSEYPFLYFNVQERSF